MTTPLSSALCKKELRRTLKSRLARLSTEEKASESHALCLLLQQHILGLCPTPRFIASFFPLTDEISLLELPSLLPDICFLYPRTHKDFSLSFHQIQDLSPSSPEWENAYKGLREPKKTTSLVPLKDIELILLPGLGFTPTGERLGRGAGFYDRLLSAPECQASIWGVGFSSQEVADVYAEPHDRACHRLFLGGRALL